MLAVLLDVAVLIDFQTEFFGLTGQGKSFVYVVYGWDPVEGSFVQSFESGPRPLKEWKHHHKFAVISKDCSILKGRVE